MKEIGENRSPNTRKKKEQDPKRRNSENGVKHR